VAAVIRSPVSGRQPPRGGDSTDAERHARPAARWRCRPSQPPVAGHRVGVVEGGAASRGGFRAKGWCVGSASSARLSPAVPSHAADDMRMNLFLPGCRGAGPGGLCGRPRRVLRCQSCSSMRACCWGWRWTRDRLLAVHLDDGVPDSAPGAFGEGRSVVVPAGSPGCASSRGGQRAGVPARRVSSAAGSPGRQSATRSQTRAYRDPRTRG
jgi:hypothetical protein